MKTLLYTIFSAILFVNPVISKETGKTVPEFMITEVRANNTLKPNEAVFIFTCKTSDSGLLKQSIKYSANGVNKIAQPNSNGKFTVKLRSGKYKFQFFLNTSHFEIYSDSVIAKSKTITEVDLLFKSSEIMMIEDKPVIYLYPQQKTNVTVKLDLKGELLFTYPTYNNGWEVEANPDGTLNHNNKEYNYLFWEGQSKITNADIKLEEGYIVKYENLLLFLEEKLNAMGLSSKEQQDFITYWYPRMNKNSNNYIHFLFNNDFAKYAQLEINPKPDNVFRVFMVWSKIEANSGIYTKPQEIQKLNRKGFTVVEWGGSEMNYYQEEPN